MIIFNCDVNGIHFIVLLKWLHRLQKQNNCTPKMVNKYTWLKFRNGMLLLQTWLSWLLVLQHQKSFYQFWQHYKILKVFHQLLVHQQLLVQQLSTCLSSVVSLSSQLEINQRKLMILVFLLSPVLHLFGLTSGFICALRSSHHCKLL